MIQTLNIAAAAAFACTLDRKALGAALTLAGKVTEARNTIPILSTVRLGMAGDQLTIEATDLDLFLTVPVPADHGTGGAVHVDLKTLAGAVKKMKGARVRVQDIGGRIVLTDTETGGSVRIPTLPGDDWPQLAAASDPVAFTVPADQFAADLARIRPAISTEETRYYLNGIYFHAHRAAYPGDRTPEHEAATEELAAIKAADQAALDASRPLDGAEPVPIDPDAQAARDARKAELGRICAEAEAIRCAPDSLRMAATDGHRLHYVTRPLPEGAAAIPPAILPRKAVAVAQAIMGKKAAGDVGLSFGPCQFAAEFGAVQLRGKLIDGTFPDYTRVIPSGNQKVLTIDADEIAQLAQSVTAHCNERTRALGISLSEEATIFSAVSPEAGVAAAQAHGAEFRGEAMAIGFNAKYLSDIAQAFAGLVLAVNLEDSSAPTLFRTPAAAEFAAVLMPTRIGSIVESMADLERLNRSPWDSFADDIAVPVQRGLHSEVRRLIGAARAFLTSGGISAGAQRAAIKAVILTARGDAEGAARVQTVQALIEGGPRGSFNLLGTAPPLALPPAVTVAPAEVDPLAFADAIADATLADVKVPDAPVPPLPPEVETPPPVQMPDEPAPAAPAPAGPPDRYAALEARLAALEAIIESAGQVQAGEISEAKDPAANSDLDPVPVEATERDALEGEIDRLRAVVAAQASTIARLKASRTRMAGRVQFMRGALKREKGINKQLLGQVADMLKRRDGPVATPESLPPLPPLPTSLQPPAIVLPAVATSRREPVEVG